MTTQQQRQQIDISQAKAKTRKWLSKRVVLVSIVIIVAAIVTTIWILSNLRIIPGSWATIFTTIIAVLGAVFAFLQVMHVASSSPQQLAPIIVHIPPTESLPPQPSFEKPAHRGIVGFPPLTDGRAIQQREQLVKEVYIKLMQDDITAIALTGIGGVGKSTLAALIYHYAEDQRHKHSGPFLAETIWLMVDPAVTFADLAGNLCEALGKSLPDLGNLAPHNQALALFNALNSADEPHLIILDQFENLLDWDTGHALTDRPGVGEWLDIINSRPCACRILLTSRPRPVGTRKYPPTYLQEYAVGGLKMDEGIALLQSRGVSGNEAELRTAISHCAGHAFSLTLLATLMRDHHMDLTTLFKNSALWTGDIATNLLDQIYIQKLNEAQRELLLAFSVYREPVPIEAAQAIISNTSIGQLSSALKTLLTQCLLEAMQDARYQLHAIIADYAQGRFGGNNEQANEEALRVTHIKAAQYYLKQAEMTCPPREKRRKIADVHDIVEAIWQFCQAEQWQEAYNLMLDEGLFNDLARWGENAILLELCQILLSLQKLSINRLQVANLYNNLGHVCRILGLMRQSLGYYEEALQIWKSAGNRAERAGTLDNLARVYYDLGDRERALEYIQKALKIYQEEGDLRGEGKTLNNLGRVYESLAQEEQAKLYFERALELHRIVGDREEEGWTLYTLGRVYYTWGQKEYALKLLEETLTIHNEAGNRDGEGWTHLAIGRVYNALGQNEKAWNYHENALIIHREIGDRRGEAWSLSHLGKVCNSLGENERACDYLEQALEIFKQVGDSWGEGWVLNNIGQIYLDLNNDQKALELLEKALTIRRLVGDYRGVGRTLRSLGSLFIEKDHKRAISYLEQSLKISKELQDRDGEAQVLREFGIIHIKEMHYDIALAFLLVAKRMHSELNSKHIIEVEKTLNMLQLILSKDEFVLLFTKVEPQVQEIVNRALNAWLDE